MIFLIPMNIPARAAHPNARCHWSVHAKAKRASREEAMIETLRLLGSMRPRWEKAQLRLWYGFEVMRKRDPDNLVAWAKGPVDGLVRAGLLANDDKVTWLPVQVIVPAPQCMLIEVGPKLSSTRSVDGPVREAMRVWSCERGHRRLACLDGSRG